MIFTEFAEKLKKAATETNTVYMKGTFGAPLTEKSLCSRAKQYPSWYTPEKMKRFRSLIGKNYFGFDCVCLIKGIVWGWNGNKDHVYGGAVYCSNGLKDLSVSGMKAFCTQVSSDFSTVRVGEILFLPGHVGVYIGDGLACECTSQWGGRVMITAVKNMGAKKGYKSRTWHSHGFLPVIDYGTATLLGDVDGNGKIEKADHMLVRSAVLGKTKLCPEAQKRADVNGDGRVDAADYVAAKRIYLKK